MKTFNPSFDRSVGTIIHVSSQPIHEKKLRSHMACVVNDRNVHIPLSFFKLKVSPEFIKRYHSSLPEMLALGECKTDVQLHQLLSGKQIEIVQMYNSTEGPFYMFMFI